MEGYNVDVGDVYNVPNNYKSKGPVMMPEASSYAGFSGASDDPIYKSHNSLPIVQRSRCPKGAALGAIGTCCGLNCTRACALPG